MTAERILMGLLLGGVAIGCVLVLYPFISALLWAAILVFTTWPAFEWLRQRLRLGNGAAAGLMVALTAIVVVLPIGIAAPSRADDIARLRHVAENALRGGLPAAPPWVYDLPLIGQSVGDLWTTWAANIGVMLTALQPYFGVVLENGFQVLLGIASGVLMFLLALFAAFFIYLHGEAIAERLKSLLRRIAGDRAERLILVTGNTVRGVVYGILGTAIVQGFLTALGLAISGVPEPVLLGATAGLLAVLPIGAPVVWIPAAIWLAGSGHWGWGLFLAIYGTVVVSGADSVIRPWFIARGANLPFLLTVLGVLGGALAFGLLGIFLGPVLLGVGYTLMNEWAREAGVDTTG
jgi:predicted PurR-regulated permease PerM